VVIQSHLRGSQKVEKVEGEGGKVGRREGGREGWNSYHTHS